MDRTLAIEIDRASWPVPPKLPAFPSTFHRGNAPVSINIQGMLLLMGFLTTPTTVVGVSLSEYWAWSAI